MEKVDFEASLLYLFFFICVYDCACYLLCTLLNIFTARWRLQKSQSVTACLLPVAGAVAGCSCSCRPNTRIGDKLKGTYSDALWHFLRFMMQKKQYLSSFFKCKNSFSKVYQKNIKYEPLHVQMILGWHPLLYMPGSTQICAACLVKFVLFWNYIGLLLWTVLFYGSAMTRDQLTNQKGYSTAVGSHKSGQQNHTKK